MISCNVYIKRNMGIIASKATKRYSKNMAQKKSVPYLRISLFTYVISISDKIFVSNDQWILFERHVCKFNYIYIRP